MLIIIILMDDINFKNFAKERREQNSLSSDVACELQWFWEHKVRRKRRTEDEW